MSKLREFLSEEVMKKESWTITNNFKAGIYTESGYGETGSESFIMNFYCPVKRLIRYCDQLKRLHQAIEGKQRLLVNRKVIIFHNDNGHCTSLMTWQKLGGFGWEVLMHPSYSPDTHKLPLVHSYLNWNKLLSRQICENHLLKFFNQKPHKFYTDRIMALPEKWQNIIDNNGQQFVYIYILILIPILKGLCLTQKTPRIFSTNHY